MINITKSQAVEIASAFLGLNISLDESRERLSDRCKVFRLVHDADWQPWYSEVCQGPNWLECLCKILPELKWKEFSSNPTAWREYLASLRQIRIGKESRHSNMRHDLHTNDGCEPIEG